MKKIYYLLFFGFLTSLAQTQIGSGLNGEATGDFYGQSISLSADGNIMAVGAPSQNISTGYVRIFQKISGVWSQIGTSIYGEAAGDQFGYSVSLSSNGNIVAIGAPNNSGNGISSGHVRIYQNLSGIWTQVGGDIDGEAADDKSGHSVSLSADGSIVAIGAPYNDGNGNNSGHVRVFQNVSGVWTQIGTDINGEAANDQSGRSVSLNGNKIAIGAPYNDGNGLDSGHVRVFFRTVSNSWIQETEINGEAANDRSGWSVSFTNLVLAIGAPFNDGNGTDSGHVRIFTTAMPGMWTQVGTDINGEAANDQFGKSISLSPNIYKIAIGAPFNDGNGIDSGQATVFQLVTGTWTQIGTDINGEASGDANGLSISLSSDGNTVAIGAPNNDLNGENSGRVRVFELTTLSSETFQTPNFSIYPNPSKGYINITLDNDLLLEKINIYNQLGQMVKTTSTSTISTAELSKGIYNVEVITSNGKVTKKMIVE